MFSKRLKELSSKGLLRRIKDRSSSQGSTIIIDGKRLINFSSNDYLGLCSNHRIKEAVLHAVTVFGTGAGASRLLSGGIELHQRLEKLIADFKGTASALLLNSGYAANTGSIPALSDKDTAIFSDELNHASIIDGCRLSRGNINIYRHRDMDDLMRLMKRKGRERAIIVTDSVFSMNGDIAPLVDLRDIALRHGALLYIDDAHGTGVLGSGKGALEHFGLVPEPFIIQMGTLSKAIGSYGAFIAASADITGFLINTSRSFIYSTALPPHTVAASIEALRIIEMEPQRIQRLWNNREILIHGLHSIGIDIGPSETPIIPVLLKDNDSSLNLSDFLFRHGIYALAIRQPTVSTPRIRLTVTAGHTGEDIHALIRALTEARNCRLL